MKSNSAYYDPYMREIVKNPYPVYKRLRDEAPLYYNEDYDFYAVSRYDDVRRCFLDNQTFISGRGGILELMKENIQMPAGTFIFTDPPVHTMYRPIVQRLFTPRRMLGLEPLVRDLTIKVLEPLLDRDEFDFIDHIGRQLPMRVIGMLLGIPEQDLQKVRESVDSKMITEEGKPQDYSDGMQMDQSFGEYIDWRIKNPADDVTTELMNVEFTDCITGEKRKLTRDELITLFNVLAGAGNETTNRLIGWTAKTLAEYPDQRRELAQNPSLIPDALEEVLRLEPPAPHVGRYVIRDVEIQGKMVPANSCILLLAGSGNHDERAFADPDCFNIHRERTVPHLSFGSGIHTCIGNVLARLEGRVVFEELLKHIPEWDIDFENANLLSTSTVRGWDKLPAYVNANGAAKIRSRVARQAEAHNSKAEMAPMSVDGDWIVTVRGPMGAMDSTLSLKMMEGKLTGLQSGAGSTTVIENATYDSASGSISWSNKVTKPIKITSTFSGKVENNQMSGTVKAGFMGSFPFIGVKS